MQCGKYALYIRRCHTVHTPVALFRLWAPRNEDDEKACRFQKKLIEMHVREEEIKQQAIRKLDVIFI